MDIMRRFNLGRRPARSLIVAALCLCVAPAFAADLARVTGSVREMDGDPVVGARVVYRLVDTDGVFISTPTDTAGSYAGGCLLQRSRRMRAEHESSLHRRL